MSTEVQQAQGNRKNSKGSRRRIRRRLILAALWTSVLAIIVVACTAWIGFKANIMRTELQAATTLLPEMKAQIAANDTAAAAVSVEKLIGHTQAAREAGNDPLWKSVSALPWIGPNMQAASEVATSADDVARLGAAPLVKAFQSLNWKTLAPTPSGIDLSPLRTAAPKVQAAAHVVRESSKRLHNIETGNLLPQIAEPLISAREELATLSQGLDSAADAASLAPTMLGADAPRHYLLLMQNNAESRATGGIPGALAVLTLDKGHMTLESQTSAGALGPFDPPVPIDAEQKAIYSARIGKFMQDVNLTPDFATTAATAHSMWEKRTGERLDGVLSVDPVALSFMLEATGPVQIADPAIRKIGSGLPPKLTKENVVRTLLSDVYSAVEDPDRQDVYFSGAAKEIFSTVSSGKADPKGLIDAIAKGVDERRILLWSASHSEQATVGKYKLGGLISGPNVAPAQFGVYFNDGTGAKMDFWVKRTVEVAKDCTRDGYREVTLRVTSTNTAPADAATSLPGYVTGGKAFGVPEGTVQTNIVSYGPVQSNIDTVVKDGVKIPFAAQRHSQRSVGTSTISLAPGESATLEFNFGHIVQHSQPEIVVTPTVQSVKDVLLPPLAAPCE
ncbi:DUF4012 domain-containing protein [Paenarthrobacter nitroguajacolicus]|uniref:DUF4012 domain-containing protein n=1 Tax=Paenarthrobacter nitroguajacolicus TaxID=211146 RepID=UPI00248D1EF8|nr:DUF4012 domain-containing protein [Paenarthrobacter nitroguajacolicus]MDI2035756.1 hypothetical protein [Paenarthrobacter nitroguajacolicus]